MYSKLMVLIFTLVGSIAWGANFPATEFRQGGQPLSATNAIPVQLTNGTTFFGTAGIAVTQGGAFTTGRTWTSGYLTDSFTAFQGGGNWNFNLPAGASTLAAQGTTNSILTSIDNKTPALVSGRQPVDGSGVTQPVSAILLPLPTGASTEATLATRASETTLGTRASESTLSTLSAKFNSLGQKAKAGSVPVALASDSDPLPVVASGGSFNIGSITGPVALPTGAATSAAQTTMQATLGSVSASVGSTATSVNSIDGKLNSLGQKTASGSVPTVLASDQSPIPVTLPTGSQTPGFTTTSTSGTITAGAYSVTIRNTGAVDGTVLGTTLGAGEGLTFTAAPGRTLAAIAYVATGTTFKIAEVR